MEPKPSPLEQPLGLFRFVLKSAVVFGTLLGLGALLKDWSKPIDDARQVIFSVPWGLPLLFGGWLPLHLVYEVLWIRQRDRLDLLQKPRRPSRTITTHNQPGGQPRGRRPTK